MTSATSLTELGHTNPSAAGLPLCPAACSAHCTHALPRSRRRSRRQSPAAVRGPLVVVPPWAVGTKGAEVAEQQESHKSKKKRFRCGRGERRHAADDAGAAEPAEGVRPTGAALRPDARQPPAHPPGRPRTYARERPPLLCFASTGAS
jgi:hypothetical protein